MSFPRELLLSSLDEAVWVRKRMFPAMLCVLDDVTSSDVCHLNLEEIVNGTAESFSIPEKGKNLRLVGRYKFSGSDIQQATDTLRVAVFSTPEQLQHVPDILPKHATVLDLVVPTAQFEWFHLDMDEIEEDNYLTIVIQLKSGSDDSYYWGYANAVIDDLEFVTKRNS